MRNAHNDNAANRHRSVPPATFGGMWLDDIDVDVSGGRGAFTLDIITSHQQSLDRPTRIAAPHSLAQGLRDALAGREWSAGGIAMARPYKDLVIVSFAKRPTQTTVALILTRDEARELRDLLAGSAGRRTGRASPRGGSGTTTCRRGRRHDPHMRPSTKSMSQIDGLNSDPTHSILSHGNPE